MNDRRISLGLIGMVLAVGAGVWAAVAIIELSGPKKAERTVPAGKSCARPYSASSPWNTPIPSNPRVDPNSSSEIASLKTNTNSPLLGSDPTQYTFPVLDVSSNTPTLPVYIAAHWSNVTGSISMTQRYGGHEVQIPIPADAQPAKGSDLQLIIVNMTTGDEWGFWQFYDSVEPVRAYAPAGAGTSSNPLAVQDASARYWVGQQIVVGQGTPDAETALIASFPDAWHVVLTSPTTKPHNSGDQVWAMGASNGYHYNTTLSGVPPSGFASRGAGVSYLAGLIRPCEISQGHVDHALAFAYQNTTSKFVYPATKSDGRSKWMPEGTHLQLNPSISDRTLQSLGCTGACLIVAKAMRKYGMYLVDTTSHPKVYFEDDTTAHWGTTVTASTTNPIPLSDFRVIDG